MLVLVVRLVTFFNPWVYKLRATGFARNLTSNREKDAHIYEFILHHSCRNGVGGITLIRLGVARETNQIFIISLRASSSLTNRVLVELHLFQPLSFRSLLSLE